MGDKQPTTPSDADDTRLLTPMVSDGVKLGEGVRTRPTSEWPLPEWERYAPVEFLGAGGMGRVFKVWDVALQRHVALKLLTPGDARTVERFKREAQAQARVEHPNVCRVYEVGEVNGQHFIAMQLVDGVPLDQLAGDLTRDEIVLLMRGAAEGVHAANRLGLVHRDIKPSNIMVATSEDGRRQPFVVDFGLARDLGGPSHTLTDVVVGTPAYMAPEQARGQTVDRRTDVYGLGATLYALLGGRPPVAGNSAAEMLLNLLNQEPESLRRCNAAIPRDLETIVMTCLTSAPQERYESARALADDMARFLDGDVIAAQPPSLIARWARKARRHRSVVAVGAAGVTVAALLLGLWAHAVRGASLQAELAQRFGQEVERIEGVLWRARSLPCHDMTATRRAARARVETLEAAMDREGQIAREPGHAAIGRALYALYDFEGARTHLEAAWEAGYRPPEVAETLALVLWELYQESLGELKRVADDAVRDARREEIRRTLGDPAVDYLDAASAAGETTFARALRAALEGHHETAIQIAGAVFEAEPWRLEAKVLEGREEQMIAERRLARGEYDQAAAGLERAASALEEAVQIGRSDLRAWESLCSVRSTTLHLRVWRTGDATEASRSAAVEACTSAIEIAPDRHLARGILADALITWSEHLWSTRGNPEPTLQRVVELVESVLADDPEHLRALSMLAAAHWQRGKLAWLRGDGVPEEELGAGAAAARKATELYPSDVQGHSTLGLVLLELASSQMQSGIDPSEAADEAAAAFARAAMLTPESAGPVVNEAMVHVVRAQYLIGQGEEISDERAERAAQLLDQAEQLLQHALRLEPSSSWVQRTMAEVLWYRGQLVAADEEQCALTDQAVAHLRRCVESRPTDGSCWQYLLQCRGVQRWCVGQLGDGRTADDVAATIRDEADAAYAAVPQLDTPAMRRWVEELAAGNNAGS